MTDTAATQLRRILAVIPQLADDREHSVDQIAETVGVDAATLRRDLWSLVTRFQEPGGFVEGVQLYLEADRVELLSNHFRRPMRLTTSELCALELGLAVLHAQAAPDEQQAIDRVRGRLRQIITRLGARADSDALRHATIGPDGYSDRLGVIRSALRSRRKLRITYRRGDATDSSERLVSPYALVAASGMYYVIAHCDLSDGVRIFRLDRIEDVGRTDETFTPPDNFSTDEVFRDGRVFDGHEPATMTVRYSARIARWIAEREGVEVAQDGSVTIEHPLADVDWAVRHVLQYGPDAQVLAPDAVREAVIDRLNRMEGASVQH